MFPIERAAQIVWAWRGAREKVWQIRFHFPKKGTGEPANAVSYKGASRRKQRDLAPLRRALDLCTYSVVCGPFPCPFPLTRLQDCNAHGPCAVRGLCKCQPQTALQVTAQARYRQDRIEALRTVDSHSRVSLA